MEHVTAITKTGADSHRLLTHCTICLDGLHIVFERCRKLYGRGNDRYIVKITDRHLPFGSSQRDVYNETLGFGRLEDCPHKHEDIVRHTSTVTDHPTSHGFGKRNCQTKKYSVGLEEISNDGDDCERGGFH